MFPIVYNWKHCQYVEKYFDQKGIEATAYEEAEIIENYNTVKKFSNVSQYIIIIMSTIILIVCYKNILKKQ